MRPTLRLVDDANVGAIAGHVDSELIAEECLPKVYVFSGSGVTPDDLEEAAGADADPLVVASVAIENGSTAYAYRAAFLPPGSTRSRSPATMTTLPRTSRSIFTGAQNVTVQANLIATADFAAPAS